MNKLLLILSALTIVIIGTIVSAGCGCDKPHIDLIAGGGNAKSAIDVGDVIVNQCSNNHLHVTYETSDDWCITETHLHAAGSLDDIPQTNKGKGKGMGNPIPGQFDYSTDHDPCVTKVDYTIPIANIVNINSNEVIIAAHAVVCNKCACDCECTCDCETAWGTLWDEDEHKGYNFPGKNWAMYMNYTIGSVCSE